MNTNIRDRKIVGTKAETFGRFIVVKIEDENKRIGVGVSRCSSLDKFNSITGLKIAEGRALKALDIKYGKKRIRNMFMG